MGATARVGGVWRHPHAIAATPTALLVASRRQRCADGRQRCTKTRKPALRGSTSGKNVL